MARITKPQALLLVALHQHKHACMFSAAGFFGNQGQQHCTEQQTNNNSTAVEGSNPPPHNLAPMKAQLGASSNSRTLQHPPQLLQQQQRVCSSRRSAPHRQRAFNDRQTAVDSLEDLEIAVPVDQRPVNELSALKEAFLYKDVRHNRAGSRAACAVLAPHTLSLLLCAGNVAPQRLPWQAWPGVWGDICNCGSTHCKPDVSFQQGGVWTAASPVSRDAQQPAAVKCKRQTAESTSSPFSSSIWKLVGPPPTPTHTHRSGITVCLLLLLHALCLLLLLHALCLPAPADPQPLEFMLSATTGSLLVVSVLMLRIFLGWSYVQERLRSAAVPYEETGW